jgi:hypothetical protein
MYVVKWMEQNVVKIFFFKGKENQHDALNGNPLKCQ